MALAGLMALSACSSGETYADQKKRERTAISSYIAKEKIKVITEDEFYAKDSVTDTAKNEFVLFESSGVYMQIVRKGCGEKMKDGENLTVLCRFTERNLLTDSLQLSNDIISYASLVDKMNVRRRSGSYSASFVSGSSVMYSAYGDTAVPSGWLVPLAFVNLGRPASKDDQIAKVRIIVPHTEGQQYAIQGVYPCLYDITYERGR